jgi:hypothetical protein
MRFFILRILVSMYDCELTAKPARTNSNRRLCVTVDRKWSEHDRSIDITY